MITLIWRKSGSLRSKVENLKLNAKAIKADIQSAEDGAVVALENLASELGTIREIKKEILSFGV